MSPTFAPSSVISLLLIGLLLQISLGSSQNFDPNVDDREYLDTIQKRLREAALDAHHVLINQTKVLQQVTRTFIETKIKENLFMVVRERVEMELEEMAKNNSSISSSSATSFTNSSRQARQDEEDDDDAGSGSTTPRPRPPGLLPQLANVVSTLFGSDVNVTGYLTDATAFLPSDISSRIITAASLIDPARFTSTTEAPQVVNVNGQVIPQHVIINGTTYTYTPAVAPQGVQSNNFIQNQGVAAAPQNTNLNSNNYSAPQQSGVDQAAPQSQSSFIPQSSAAAGGVTNQQQQPGNNAETNVSPQQHVQLGVNHQQQQFNANIGNVGFANRADSQQQPSSAVLTDTIPNFKVNDAYIPIFPARTTPAFSNEDEGEDNDSSEKTPPVSVPKTPQDEEDSSEDDLPLTRDDIDSAAELEDDPSITRDDQASAAIGYLDEYPIFKYGIRIFQRLTARATVPTTTEFMNTTTIEKTLDSIEEEEAKATSPATSTYKQVVMSGVYLYEGAREAYQLLQHVNKFLDRIGTRLDSYGYGAEEVGVEV